MAQTTAAPAANPTPTPIRNRRTFTFSAPSIRWDDYHAGKFVVAILLGLVAAYAGYQGWITLPSINGTGGLVAVGATLVVLAALVWAVNTDNTVLRNLALAIALVGGIVVGANIRDYLASFAGFSVQDWLGFTVGIVLLVVTAGWLARKH